MKPQNPFLILLCCLVFFCNPARSQDSTAQVIIPADTIAISPFLSFMMLNFEFERPDTTFEKIPNVYGYENAAGARLTYQLYPAPFPTVVKDYSKKKLAGADSILFQRKATVNAINGYLVKLLYKSRDTTHEDHYGLFFLFPYQNGTVNMVSVYPVSQDLIVYAKILRSFGTMKVISNERLMVKK